MNQGNGNDNNNPRGYPKYLSKENGTSLNSDENHDAILDSTKSISSAKDIFEERSYATIKVSKNEDDLETDNDSTLNLEDLKQNRSTFLSKEGSINNSINKDDNLPIQEEPEKYEIKNNSSHLIDDGYLDQVGLDGDRPINKPVYSKMQDNLPKENTVPFNPTPTNVREENRLYRTNQSNRSSGSGIRFSDMLIGKIFFFFFDLIGEFLFVIIILLLLILYIVNV